MRTSLKLATMATFITQQAKADWFWPDWDPVEIWAECKVESDDPDGIKGIVNFRQEEPSSFWDLSPVHVYATWANLDDSWHTDYEMAILESDASDASCDSASTMIYYLGQLWYNWNGGGRFYDINDWLSLSENDNAARKDILGKNVALRNVYTHEVVACCTIRKEGEESEENDGDDVIDDRRRRVLRGEMIGNADELFSQLN